MKKKSTGLKFEPASKPLHISIKQLFLNCPAQVVVDHREFAWGRKRCDVKVTINHKL